MTANQISQEKNDSDAEVIPADVQYYIENITNAFRRSVDDIFETARWCAEADEKLENMFGSRQMLLSHLPFSEAYFSKLVSLHNDPKFKNPDVRKLLSPSFSTIDELRRLTTAQFDRAMEQGLITPELKRADVMKLLGRQRSSNAEYVNMILFAGIYIPKDYSDDAISELNEVVNQLQVGRAISIKTAYMDKELKKEVTQWKRKPRLALKQARKFLREAKAKHKKFRSTRPWPYSKDETELNKFMTIEEMMKVMSLIDYADQFQTFLKSQDMWVPEENG